MLPRIFLLLIFVCSLAFGKTIGGYTLHSGQPSTGPVGNGITDLVSGRNCLWIGSGEGLSRLRLDTHQFESFQHVENMPRGSISALFAKGDTVWVAAAADSFIRAVGETLPYGTGLAVSTDNGATWTQFKQPGVTPVQNLCYDLTIVDGVVWGACFGGGLIRSDDWGKTWKNTAPDTFVFDPAAYLNHRVFSVLNADGVLWVGTAGGVNKSTDNGRTWTNFNARNQQNPISGDFVVALAQQKTEDRNIIWAATWRAEGQKEYYGLSKTEDGGASWKVCLKDIKVQNIAADGAVVYAATHEGLYKSPDFGETWYRLSDPVDAVTGERVYAQEYYSCYAHDGQVWAGSADGLAYTADNGYTWKIFRAFRPTGVAGEPRTYAYPNPFSPKRHNQLYGEGYVRMQYRVQKDTYVTVKIYDFALDLVATVCEHKFRPGPGDYAEVWDGRNEYRDEAANGVYFYSVTVEGEGTFWGKILLVN
ncbi:MAG: hypothetical protein ONB24_04220 [candidate division KSB1 bacterium]|nr:hypothetical protein [candidate division KSB1 bacterium]